MAAVARRRARRQITEPEAAGDARLSALNEILDELSRRGVVRLTGVFDADAAAAMQNVVWQEWATREGVVREDPRTWSVREPWKTLPRAKRDPVFGAVLGPSLCELADAVLGRGWTASTGFGNVLASFPDATTWTVPGRDALWHSDARYCTPMDPIPTLRVFAVFGDTPPGGGGTLLVAGSHRMVDRFLSDKPAMRTARAVETRRACHRSNPWLAELTRGNPSDPTRVERFMALETDVDGIPAQVVEACGPAGTVYVCHPWTIHCRPPNAADRPRMLRSPTLSRGA